jgi:hypothetical protein
MRRHAEVTDTPSETDRWGIGKICRNAIHSVHRKFE